MFKCGDKVLYGSHGVCEILDTELRKIDRKTIEFYILWPFGQPDARFYIPTNNTLALSKLHPILSAEEIVDLLKDIAKQPNEWIDDEGIRKQRYKELISSGDRASLIMMIHRIRVHRKQQELTGRKLHLCDENFLRDAEKLIGTEFSIVLGMSSEEVGFYIKNMVEK